MTDSQKDSMAATVAKSVLAQLPPLGNGTNETYQVQVVLTSGSVIAEVVITLPPSVAAEKGGGQASQADAVAILSTAQQ
eukprot:2663166-Heterocapsa_arctica.AAC.1